MKRPELARHLKNSTFRRELNTALWMPAFENQGVLDEGWSCRDHAWIVAALARSFGTESQVFHGRAVFAGPTARFMSLMDVQFHSWAGLAGMGFWDLSLRPNGNARGMTLAPVVGNTFLPPFPGSVHIARDEADFQRQTAGLRAKPKVTTAIYWPVSNDVVALSSAVAARNLINSPLTDGLNEQFGQADYERLLLHLRQMLLGEQKPLASQGQTALWKQVLAK